MKPFYLFLATILLLYSCAEEPVNEDLFDMPYRGEEDITLSDLSLENVPLTGMGDASVGDFYVTDKRIGFIDLGT